MISRTLCRLQTDVLLMGFDIDRPYVYLGITTISPIFICRFKLQTTINFLYQWSVLCNKRSLSWENQPKNQLNTMCSVRKKKALLGMQGHLKGLNTLSDFFTIFTRKTTLWLPVSIIAHQTPSGKGSTLKGKNLLPLGANSFLLK